MKLLIFFLIFFLLFTPTGIAEEEPHTLILMFRDSSNSVTIEPTKLVDRYELYIYDENYNGVDLSKGINRIPDNTTIKPNDVVYVLQDKIPYGNYIIHVKHHYKIPGTNEYVEPSQIIVSDTFINFTNESKFYPVILNEIKGRPVDLIMFELAKESKFMSSLALVISFITVSLTVLFKYIN